MFDYDALTGNIIAKNIFSYASSLWEQPTQTEEVIRESMIEETAMVGLEEDILEETAIIESEDESLDPAA